MSGTEKGLIPAYRSSIGPVTMSPTGLVHPSGSITEPIKTLATVVTVGNITVSLKENARISKVLFPGGIVSWGLTLSSSFLSLC